MKWSKTAWCFVLLLVCVVAGLGAVASSASAAVTPDGDVTAMLSACTQAELQPAISDLSGATPAIVGGVPYLITTRFAGSGTPIDKAEQYVYERLSSYGLDSVVYNDFTGAYDGRNIIGEIVGTTAPDQIVVICAHLDDKPSTGLAPGADDNASGVSAVLFMARQLVDHPCARTVRFCIFGNEENRGMGADTYCAGRAAAGDDIVGAYNMDMLAYNNGSELLGMHIHKKKHSLYPGDLALAQKVVDADAAYGIANVTPAILADANPYSDQYSFWRNGYNAIWLVDDMSRGQWDPNNHTSADTIGAITWTYYVAGVKATLAGAAHTALVE